MKKYSSARGVFGHLAFKKGHKEGIVRFRQAPLPAGITTQRGAKEGAFSKN